jgi:hypothetical protein
MNNDPPIVECEGFLFGGLFSPCTRTSKKIHRPPSRDWSEVVCGANHSAAISDVNRVVHMSADLNDVHRSRIERFSTPKHFPLESEIELMGNGDVR